MRGLPSASVSWSRCPQQNDRNEGALGLYRYLAGTMPNISQHNYTSRAMWEQNKTATYTATLSEADVKPTPGHKKGLAAQTENDESIMPKMRGRRPLVNERIERRR